MLKSGNADYTYILQGGGGLDSPLLEGISAF